VVSYIDQLKDAARVRDYILNKNITEIGFDTEFTGVDFENGDNCVLKSKLDVWSIALFDGGLHPRGYKTSRGVTLSSSVISVFKDILQNKDILKYCHNAPVDIHTCNNIEIDVVGIIDTLSLARWTFPERLLYGIDILSREFLDQSKFISFDELCKEPVFEDKEFIVKYCSCGVEGCRKRKGHPKIEEKIIESVQTRKKITIPISDIQPGHPKFDMKKEYAAQDAVLALCLGDYCNRKLKGASYENPFSLEK